MRRTSFVAIAAALAACGGEPAAHLDGRAAERAPAAPPAAAPLASPAPARGDRHARAAARKSPGVKRMDGKLARSDDRAVVIGAPDAPSLTLRVAPGTTVTLDGRPARAEALPPGAEVRVAYRKGDGGRPTALTIEARRPRAARGTDDGGPDARPDAASAPWEGSPDFPPDDGG